MYGCGIPQKACCQQKEEKAVGKQIAVGLLADLELGTSAAFNQSMNLLGGEGWYSRGDLVYLPLSRSQSGYQCFKIGLLVNCGATTMSSYARRGGAEAAL